MENGVEGTLLEGEGVVAAGLQLGNHLVAVHIAAREQGENEQSGAAGEQAFVGLHGGASFLIIKEYLGYLGIVYLDNRGMSRTEKRGAADDSAAPLFYYETSLSG